MTKTRSTLNAKSNKYVVNKQENIYTKITKKIRDQDNSPWT